MSFNIDLKKAGKVVAKAFDYGTSGFRSKAEELDHVVYRTGILSVLRSKKKNGDTIGLMITASHNPDCDNGVKLIDPDGEMLEASWEKYAAMLVNANDKDLEGTVKEIAQRENINLSNEASVFIGRDTRSSSPKLARLALEGVDSMQSEFIDYGIVTTPVLHYMVYCKNIAKVSLPRQSNYDSKLVDSFKILNSTTKMNSKYSNILNVDCSNGVGSIKMKDLVDQLKESLTVHIYNDGNGVLNHRCGADFVKVNQQIPDGIPLEPRLRYVSLDGDADRLIYFYIDENKKFHMLDGDRIAILIAEYLMDLIKTSKLDISLGLVQTAYANGNSTDYISNKLKVPVACVPTGVKHLHHKAKEFDVGVYFEANGHGTVVYSKKAEEKVKAASECSSLTNDERNAAIRLRNFIQLTNQTVGDAISDVLLVETVLKAKDWSVEDWEKCYTDLPNKLSKVIIQDRKVIETTDAERRCVKPAGLQEEIDKLVANYNKGRSFVRPSGTEDLVRVYSEAATQAEADELGLQVSLLVSRMAGGVSNPPQ